MRALSGATGAVPGPAPDSGFEGLNRAPVAQLDRVLGYEPRGREFESLRARQFHSVYAGDRRVAVVLSGCLGPRSYRS
jgi:hypothetical protein